MASPSLLPITNSPEGTYSRVMPSLPTKVEPTPSVGVGMTVSVGRGTEVFVAVADTDVCEGNARETVDVACTQAVITKSDNRVKIKTEKYIFCIYALL